MVPMWSAPIALTLGNCVIMKPSKQASLTMCRLVELMVMAGIPHGVVQVLHGKKAVVHALCDHPGISAVSFVGSSKVAEIVSKRCHAVNKRVLALGGAKNHLLALPDCDVAMASRDIVASFAGCCGQRCMAASVLLLVGDGSEEVKQAFTDTLLKEVITAAGLLVAGQKGGQVGPIISAAAQARYIKLEICKYASLHLFRNHNPTLCTFTESWSTSTRLRQLDARSFWTDAPGPRIAPVLLLAATGWVLPSSCTPAPLTGP